MGKKLPPYIEAQRKWLEDNEKSYRMAVAITGDVNKLRGLLRSLKQKFEPLMAYNPDTQPVHSAVYIVSSTKERVEGLFEDLEFVEDYEDRKERYLEAVKAHALGDDETETTD